MIIEAKWKKIEKFKGVRNYYIQSKCCHEKWAKLAKNVTWHARNAGNGQIVKLRILAGQRRDFIDTHGLTQSENSAWHLVYNGL